LKAYYLPNSKHRLASVSAVTDTYSPEYFLFEDTGLLSGIPNDPKRRPIHIQRNASSQLSISIGHVYHTIEQSVNNANIVTTVSEQNINLSPAQKELLRWHHRLGHVGFDRVKFLLRSGALATSTAARRLHRLAAKVDVPKCGAYQYAKQRVRLSPGKKSAIVTDRAGVIRKNNLLPGQEVSVDHFVCSEKGRLFTSRGKTADKDMYADGCIFVDHSCFIL